MRLNNAWNDLFSSERKLDLSFLIIQQCVWSHAGQDYTPPSSSEALDMKHLSIVGKQTATWKKKNKCQIQNIKTKITLSQLRNWNKK